MTDGPHSTAEFSPVRFAEGALELDRIYRDPLAEG